MNEIKNDKGEWVVAVGAPGSVERVNVEWPALIEGKLSATVILLANSKPSNFNDF